MLPKALGQAGENALRWLLMGAGSPEQRVTAWSSGLRRPFPGHCVKTRPWAGAPARSHLPASWRRWLSSFCLLEDYVLVSASVQSLRGFSEKKGTPLRSIAGLWGGVGAAGTCPLPDILGLWGREENRGTVAVLVISGSSWNRTVGVLVSSGSSWN